MHSIENLVFEETCNRLNEMSEMKTTTEEYKATADVAMKLITLTAKMEETKIQAKANELKEKELEESRKKRQWDFAKEIIKETIKVAVPAATALVGGIMLTNLERTESVLSTAPRDLWKMAFRLK